MWSLAWALLLWFGPLVVWALWVSEKVRRLQHQRTKQRHLDILKRELRRLSEQDSLPTHVRYAAQDALIHVMRHISEGNYE